MNKIKYKHIQLNPYNTSLLFLDYCTSEKLKKFVKKLFPDDYAENEMILEVWWIGRTVLLSNGVIIIALKHKLDASNSSFLQVLSHEAFHATEFLFDRIGIKHSLKCGEAYAYMIWFIVKEVIDEKFIS